MLSGHVRALLGSNQCFRGARTHLQIGFLRGETKRPARMNDLVRSRDRVIRVKQTPVEVHHSCLLVSSAVQIASSTLRATLRHQLIAHSTERDFEVFHPSRVDDGIQERFQDDEAIHSDPNR